MPIVVELVSVLLGVHRFMSLHVFVGLLLIPPVVVKLASTGWRFARYYLRSDDYVVHGAPQLAMRLLAAFLVAATVVLFASGVAMGILHGHALVVARRLHGPASVVWIVLVGVHVLVYLKRSLIRGTEDITAARRASERAPARKTAARRKTKSASTARTRSAGSSSRRALRPRACRRGCTCPRRPV